MSHRDVHKALRVAVRLAKPKFPQKQIAEEIGTKEGTFSNFMNGGSLGPDLTTKLQDWLLSRGFLDSKEIVEGPRPSADPLDAVAEHLRGVARGIESSTSPLPYHVRVAMLEHGMKALKTVLMPIVEEHLRGTGKE